MNGASNMVQNMSQETKRKFESRIQSFMVVVIFLIGFYCIYCAHREFVNADTSIELDKLRTAIIMYESSLNHKITCYKEISRDVNERDLEKLIDNNFINSIRLDRWQHKFKIDIEAGIIYSQGPNLRTSFEYYRYSLNPKHSPTLPMSVNDAIRYATKSNGKDGDIIVSYKARFRPIIASYSSETVADKNGSTVIVEFSDAISENMLTSDIQFKILPTQSSTPPSITEVSMVENSPHMLKILLDGALEPISKQWMLSVSLSNNITSLEPHKLGITNRKMVLEHYKVPSNYILPLLDSEEVKRQSRYKFRDKNWL
jgi:hypothetical protein